MNHLKKFLLVFHVLFTNQTFAQWLGVQGGFASTQLQKKWDNSDPRNAYYAGIIPAA